MTATGKAAVFHGPGKPFELTLLPLPEVEPRAALIRVSVANICGSDLHFWRGDAPLKLPDDGWIYGHEMCGRVARLGVEIKTGLGIRLPTSHPRRASLTSRSRSRDCRALQTSCFVWFLAMAFKALGHTKESA